MSPIYMKRTPAIVAGIAVLLLAPLGCGYFSKKEPEDVVNVIQKEVAVPEGFAKTFTDLGVKGLILVSGGDGEPLTIRVVTPDGKPINLCGSDKSSQDCKLTTSAGPLLSVASLTATCGTCSDGSTRRQCHKDGTYKNKWYCHTGSNDTYPHHNCLTPCG